MNFRSSRGVLPILLTSMSLLLTAGNLYAQARPGSLTGVVSDPSGGDIAKAAVRLVTSSGASIDATTNRDGVYEFKNLSPGTYTLKAVAKGFALFTKEDVQIVAGQLQQINIPLTIQIEEQQVEVTDSSTTVGVDPTNNAGAVVLKGADLEALSDDPDELQSELQALAGPSAGPNGGQIYIDGFTGGTLPPKASIREIRLNQNPFSAEYDKLGYGRIEILTKPGTDKFHGQLLINGNDSAFNARNPFEGHAVQPGYHSVLYSGNIGGPISKKASFFFNLDRRNLDEISIVSAPALDANLNPIQFTDAIPNPRTRTNLTPRVDYQLSSSNTLTARYQYFRENEINNGVSQFSLPTQGFNELNTEHTLQISDTKTLNERTINETRFQYVRSSSSE